MHVLHIIDSLGVGGAERMMVDLANATASQGHVVSACVTRGATQLAHELDPRVRLLVLDRRHRVAIGASLTFAAWVRRLRPDVLHVHMRSSLAYVLALRSAGLIRTPIVFHDHYGSIEVDTSIPAWFRIAHPMIGHYVGVYDKLTAWAQRAGVPAARATTIPNGIDLRRFSSARPGPLREELGIPAELPIGIAVASFKRDKGIELLIDALSRCRQPPRSRILVAGGTVDPSYADACRGQIRLHGLDGVVAFLGPRHDVPALLASADFALLSSHTESGPLVLVEYLAAGLPIVATRVGDIGRRLADLGVPGFVAAGDTVEFARELETLLALSPAERAARGSAGRSILGAEWDIRASVPRWLAVYEKAMTHRQRTVKSR